MEINLNALKSEEPRKVIDLLKSQKQEFKISHDEAEKQFDPKRHRIFDKSARPDKFTQQYRGKGRDGKAIYDIVMQPVTRMAIPYQRLIVERLIGTMLGNPIKLKEESLLTDEAVQTDLFRGVKKVWKDNKLDFLNREVLRSLLSEMEVAEIWYPVKDLKGEIELKCRIVSPFRGDALYPFFDVNGSLVAFSREYKVKRQDGIHETRLDAYLKEGTLKFVKTDGDYSFEKLIPNILGKLPVVYYCQDAPEWNDIQEVCDRQDTLISNFADTNDYFASPMIVVTGKVEGFAEKGEQGKIVTLSSGADIRYLTWDSGPEAIKTEFENNEDVIYGSMQIPNFQWSRIKNIGNLQNAILKLFFTDPHMKAETKWEIFGIGLQRRLNLLSTAVHKLYNTRTSDLEIIIEAVMTPYVPENIKEIVDSLITATGGEPVLSQRRAVKLNPLVDNPETEMEILGEESVRRQSESFVMGQE